jgi:hypothetical protein
MDIEGQKVSATLILLCAVDPHLDLQWDDLACQSIVAHI